MTELPIGVQRSVWAWLGLPALWSAAIAAALVVDAPLGAAHARQLASGLLGPAVAGYLGYCPLPLATYFFAALALRHPLALLLAARARASVDPAPAPSAASRALIAAYAAGSLLAGGGAAREPMCFSSQITSGTPCER